MNQLDQQIKRWSWGILILGLLLVLFMTVAPVSFTLPADGWPGLGQRVDLRLEKWRDSNDLIRNILLFVPLGFGLGLLLREKRSSLRTLTLAALAGFGLSLLVEGLQLFNIYRIPAAADVMANMLGALAGSLLAVLAGWQILTGVITVSAAIKHFMLRHRLAASLILSLLIAAYLVFVWQFSNGIVRQISFDNWDTSYPVTLGNVKSGDFPWTGTIASLMLVDEALDETAVSNLLSGTAVNAVVGADTHTTRADFPANPVLVDRDGTEIEFIWSRENPGSADARGVQVTPQNWLITNKNHIGWWLEDMRALRQFSLGLRLAASDVHYPGPARILAITDHAFFSNFSLEQQGSDLGVRMRTVFADKSDERPEWIIPAFFTDTNAHDVIVTFDGQNLRVYRDSVSQTWAASYTPDILFYRYLHPIPHWRARLGASMWGYRLLFYVAVCIPIGLLLGLLAGLWRRFVTIILIVVGAALTAWLVEMALVLPVAEPWRWERIWLALGITAVSAFWAALRVTHWEETPISA